jgi:hypothetical protein
MNKTKVLVTLAACLSWAAGPASGTLISYTFVADGVTESVAQQGTAVFTFDTTDLSTFSITLTDNVDPTAFIASELDGLEFSFSTAPTSLALELVDPDAVINCTSSTDPCPAGVGSTPYGWGTTLTGDDATLGAGFTGSGFSYHPYAIVNVNYDAPGGNGGISNNQHNPLLVGPVTFTFSVEGLTSVPEITNVAFLFGTVPDSQGGVPQCTNGDCGDLNVPEPQTLALIGLGLLSLGWVSRRRKRIH